MVKLWEKLLREMEKFPFLEVFKTSLENQMSGMISGGVGFWALRDPSSLDTNLMGALGLRHFTEKPLHFT